MKPIVLSPPAPRANRQRYAVQRMNAAASRLLRANSPSEEIQAGYWVLAWAVVAGARPSARALRAAENSMGSLAQSRLH